MIVGVIRQSAKILSNVNLCPLQMVLLLDRRQYPKQWDTLLPFMIYADGYRTSLYGTKNEGWNHIQDNYPEKSIGLSK